MFRHSPVDPKKFWEEKIIAWEVGRYGLVGRTRQSIFEKIADKSSESLRRRLILTSESLRPFVIGKNVLELGCGSGLLTSAIMEGGASSYLGIDIASTALKIAKTRQQKFTWANQVKFETRTVEEVQKQNFDLVISLGLTDWLSDKQMYSVFSLSEDCDCFHSISENRFNWSQIIHKAYVNIAYGYKTGGYKPRYYSEAQIAEFTNNMNKKCNIFRHPDLKFGAFVSSLPINLNGI